MAKWADLQKQGKPPPSLLIKQNLKVLGIRNEMGDNKEEILQQLR